MTSPLGPAHHPRALLGSFPLIIIAITAVSLAGCAATGAPVMPPPDAPPASSGGCSPGWSPGADGRCQRDPSNFGGPPIYFGPQARAIPPWLNASAAPPRSRPRT